jgi:hypothetical protein
LASDKPLSGFDEGAIAAALRDVYDESVYLLTETDIQALPPRDLPWLLASAMAEMPVMMAGVPALPRHGLAPRAGRRTVGRRRDALQRLGGAPPVTGRLPVIVFVVDTGIDAEWMSRVFPGRLLGRLGDETDPIVPATAMSVGLPRRHAHVTVRNVLAMAPEALIVDVPLLPASLVDFSVFLHRAYFVFRAIRTLASKLRKLPGLEDLGVVVVNAWGVYDSAQAGKVGRSYLTDRTHAVNAEVIAAAGERIDCVFAAGNTSRLVRDPRVGAYDGEPYRSIYGASAMPEALCVTSIRIDGLWPGYASRGPAPAFANAPPVAPAAATAPAARNIGAFFAWIVTALGALTGRAHAETGGPEQTSATTPPPPPQGPKPDVAAPSDFAEDEDETAHNLGTSASCAVAAGVVAAARSRKPELSSAALFALMRDTARPVAPEAGWNGRLGHGVIDVPGLWKGL